jgi:hypothetical protein
MEIKRHLSKEKEQNRAGSIEDLYTIAWNPGQHFLYGVVDTV